MGGSFGMFVIKENHRDR